MKSSMAKQELTLKISSMNGKLCKNKLNTNWFCARLTAATYIHIILPSIWPAGATSLFSIHHVS